MIFGALNCGALKFGAVNVAHLGSCAVGVAPRRSLPTMGRLIICALILCAFASLGATAQAADPVASVAPLAALTVTPKGSIEYDITTGVTTLPDGGTVVDKATGVTLDAASMHYVDGSYIQATGASLAGDFGRMQAQSVQIDIVAGTVDAQGELRLERDGLALTAAGMRFDAGTDVIEFFDAVGANAPAFRAERLLLDARNGDALLVGHYSYKDGIFTLTSPESGGMLELRLTEVAGVPAYDATTEVSPELLARFAAVLN